MLSLSHLELAVTPKDVVRMLRSTRRSGGPDIRDVQFGHGEAVLELALPNLLSLPVQLTVTLDGVRDGDVHLHVQWTNLALLPTIVKQAGLGRAVGALGLAEFWDGHGGLAVPLVYIQARLAASFEIETMELSPDRLLVRLRHVQAVSPELVRGGDSGSEQPPQAAASEDGTTDPEAREAEWVEAGESDEPAEAVAVARAQAPFDQQERRRYDEWRERLLQWSRSKLPPPLQAALPWVLLVPDLSVLLGRLLVDRRLSGPTRALLGAVLVYVLSPVDLVPDPIPVAGGIDDLSLILLTLHELHRQGLGTAIKEHWSGDGEPVKVVRDGLHFLRRQFRQILRMMQRHAVRLRRRSRTE